MWEVTRGSRDGSGRRAGSRDASGRRAGSRDSATTGTTTGGASGAAPLPHAELAIRIARSTGLPPNVAARVVQDVIAYFSETTQDYVRRRHRELLRKGLGNDEIFERLTDELRARPVAAPELSVRQLRRVVYG